MHKLTTNYSTFQVGVMNFEMYLVHSKVDQRYSQVAVYLIAWSFEVQVT